MPRADKLTRPIGGIPSLLRVVRVAGQVAPRVIVVTRQPRVDRYRRLLPPGIQLRTDPPGADRHPGVGLRAALRGLRSQWLLVLAGDLAHLERRDAARLVRTGRTADAIVPLDPGGMVEPLAAAYRTAVIRRVLRTPGGIRRMSDLVRGAGRVRFVPFVRDPQGPSTYRLRGVNRRGDLEHARLVRGRWDRPRTVDLPSHLFRSARARRYERRYGAAAALLLGEAARLRRAGLAGLARLAERDAAACARPRRPRRSGKVEPA